MLSSWLHQLKQKRSSLEQSKEKLSVSYHAQSLLNSFKSYAKGRAELAKVELKELLEQLKPLFVLAALMVGLSLFFVLLIEVAIFAALLHFLSWEGYLVAVVMAAAHLLFFLIFGLALRAKIKKIKPFAHSSSLSQELKSSQVEQQEVSFNTPDKSAAPKPSAPSATSGKAKIVSSQAKLFEDK